MTKYNKLDGVVAALRTYGASHVQLTRTFAESLGLHPTDANALSEVIHAEDSGDPISPAELARRMGLSRPALSACLNRLEASGHIARTHESSDRRVVTLRCDPRIYQHASKFFIGVSCRMDEVLSKVSDQEARLIENFLQQASKAIHPNDSPIK